MERLIVEHLPVGPLQCNCVIVGDPITKRALVVDPGDEVDRIAALLERHGLRVSALVATHAHIDHVGALAALKALSGAPAIMHEADLPLYRELAMQAEFLGVALPEATVIDRFVEDGARIEFGKRHASVEHTPGHTPGSISLVLAGAAPRVLSGDTLFSGSIGRTDLWGGSFEGIMRSIRTKLLALPDDTIVLPGHGPETTIGIERRSNPFLV